AGCLRSQARPFSLSTYFATALLYPQSLFAPNLCAGGCSGEGALILYTLVVIRCSAFIGPFCE
ncbi:MAG: hypothetical protein L0229_04100, partial [Blastocatellia bacterium]|nr:hypothetical protein [Blastocatellia bacterium]